MPEPVDLERRARGITTLVLDVDGVLTDGGILLASDGAELKRFDVQDGSAIVYLIRAGLRVAIISGRRAAAVEARAQELGIEDVYQGYHWKLDAFEELQKKHGLRAEEIACIGDDLPDIPLMRMAGLGVAVANARPEVIGVAHHVTRAAGGAGAVREAAEWLLKIQGKWDGILARYF